MNENKSCRDGFGRALMELGNSKKIVALSADLSPSVRMNYFKKKYPHRYFDVGVAEQNLVCVASGLAHIGKVPFISSFGAFCPGRCWEQIKTTIAYNNNNVKIIASHCGLDVGPDGATHQMLEDISLMRSIPNMIVIVPCDYEQSRKATLAISKVNSPCYMRFGRSSTPLLTKSRSAFKIGKAQVLKKGKDILVIGCGPVLKIALDASKKTEKSLMIVNMHTIKPLDESFLRKILCKFDKIITIEDHQIEGGLGSAIAEFVSQIKPCKIIRMGVNNSFGESGTKDELYKKHGLHIDNLLNILSKI